MSLLMRFKTLLFDLDGTLLPMDQEIFIQYYFKSLSEFMKPYGYKAEDLIKTVWAGTEAMVKNRSDRTNEELFWDAVSQVYGPQIVKDKPVFEEFYRTAFQDLAHVCPPDPDAAGVIEKLKSQGYRLILATNPIFPEIATKSRIQWGSLNPDDFELITTYENSSRAKPNPEYFTEILKKMNLNPSECLMIGNDLTEDGAALKAGLPLFVLTNHLINKENKNPDDYPHGGFQDLLRFLELSSESESNKQE